MGNCNLVAQNGALEFLRRGELAVARQAEGGEGRGCTAVLVLHLPFNRRSLIDPKFS